MIVVTGGAGFIGSALLWGLNSAGKDDIVVVDELGKDHKWKNLLGKQFREVVHIDQFRPWLKEGQDIECIIHMGACSSTTETDADFLNENNTRYSMDLFNYCAEKKIPYIYASSAATYGDGNFGYSDSNLTTQKLRPINKYGFSKHIFDLWALKQKHKPPFWAGLKFFNVYGPNEYHKGGQASVVFHAYPQVKEKGTLNLFKSYRKGIAHGDQKRDFVYIKDVVSVIMHLYKNHKDIESDIYNVGTGQARTFSDLGRSVFFALGKKESFDWIEMPESIKGQYQYFTQADLGKLKEQGGYEKAFFSLEDGVKDYVCNYLNDDYLVL